MCLLIVEIGMLLGGLYALITGKLSLSKTMQLEGWRARVAGIFLAAPLPLALVIGFILGFAAGLGYLDPNNLTLFAGIIELIIVFLGLGGTVAFAAMTKPKYEGMIPPPDME